MRGEQTLHPMYVQLIVALQISERPMSSVGTILLILLVVALLGGFSGYGGGPFYGTGYYGGGGLGLVLVIVLVLAVTGRI
jgi:hypothetical protein